MKREVNLLPENSRYKFHVARTWFIGCLSKPQRGRAPCARSNCYPGGRVSELALPDCM